VRIYGGILRCRTVDGEIDDRRLMSVNDAVVRGACATDDDGAGPCFSTMTVDLEIGTDVARIAIDNTRIA